MAVSNPENKQDNEQRKYNSKLRRYFKFYLIGLGICWIFVGVALPLLAGFHPSNPQDYFTTVSFYAFVLSLFVGMGLRWHYFHY